MFHPTDRIFWLLPLGAWTAVVLVSLHLSQQRAQENAFDTARQMGRDIFETIEAVRVWNFEKGRVLIPRSETNPPNPYLDIPDRDPVTTTGDKLTTINAAYMTRQIASVIARNSGIRVSITSLHPINPANTPDTWEATALRAFEQRGAKERTELIEDGAPQIRYIAPLWVTEACLGCHAANHRYALGEVRGGISVSIPARELVDDLAATNRNLIIRHAVAWAVASLLMLVYLRIYRRQWRELKQSAETLETRVAERTAALERETAAHRRSEEIAQRSHERFMDLVNTTDGVVWECDANTFEFTYVSEKAEALFGYPVADWKQPGFWMEHIHPEDRDWAPQYCLTRTQKLEPHRMDYRFLTADGRVVWIEDIVTVVAEDGVPKLLRGLLVDVSTRKAAEARLHALTRRLTLATRSAQIGIWDYEPGSGKVLWDGTMFEIFGLSLEQFTGRAEDLAPYIHPEDRDELDARIEETMRTGDDLEITFRILRGGNEVRFIEAHGVRVPAGNGQPARIIGVNRDVTEHKRNENELLRLATTDALTGCFNRAHLARQIELEIERARRHGDPLSLIMYDLDKFKQVNDTHGHTVGDQVLAHTARVSRESIRSTDVLARWGGEEFLVLCPRTSPDEARRLAERLRQALNDTPAPVAGRVTASIGVVSLQPDEDCASLIKRADDLMYRAKGGGRNQVCADHHLS